MEIGRMIGTASMKASLRRKFATLSNAEYRKYFFAQLVSLIGTTMQMIALGLLALKLTGSGTDVGLNLTFQFLPMIILGPFIGPWIDRSSDHLKLLVRTQVIAAALAFTMSVLALTGHVSIGVVHLFALSNGINNVFDNPLRRTLNRKILGRDRGLLANAAALESMQLGLARTFGSLIGSALVFWIGFAPCFFLNAVSFLSVIFVVGRLNVAEVEDEVDRRRENLLSVLACINSLPSLRSVLLITAIVGTLTFEFNVFLMLFAKAVLNDTRCYGYLFSALSVGSIIGSLWRADKSHHAAIKYIARSALCLGLALLMLAFSSNLVLAIGCAAAAGFFSGGFGSMGRSCVQHESPSSIQVSVMILWNIGFMGSTAVGAPIIGFIGQHAGARWAVTVSAVTAIVCGLVWGEFFSRNGSEGESNLVESADLETAQV